MSQKYYYTTCLGFGNIRIERYAIEKETACFIWINGKKRRKEGIKLDDPEMERGYKRQCEDDEFSRMMYRFEQLLLNKFSSRNTDADIRKKIKKSVEELINLAKDVD